VIAEEHQAHAAEIARLSGQVAELHRELAKEAGERASASARISASLERIAQADRNAPFDRPPLAAG
jgi:hypothetical protein